MNNQTKEIYEFIFKEQIEKYEKLSNEKIEELNSSKSYLGNKIIEGEKFLWFLEEETDNNKDQQITYTFKFFMYPSEIETFSIIYDFVKYVRFPIFKKH